MCQRRLTMDAFRDTPSCSLLECFGSSEGKINWTVSEAAVPMLSSARSSPKPCRTTPNSSVSTVRAQCYSLTDATGMLRHHPLGKHV